jgi:8-oxo-dGTP pyrophosphatase MutT (NUDIX family)
LGEVFDRIVGNLVDEEPAPGRLKFAAVSIIISDSEEPNVLLIKRAEQAGDPWSGQIAFPGGKMQPGDGTARRTAERETLEEVGVDLVRSGRFLGYGKATVTHTGTMEVVPSAFILGGAVKVKVNEEVASYRWVDLRELIGPGAASSYTLRFEGQSIQVPAFKAGDYVVWGLTHRILESLLKGPD